MPDFIQAADWAVLHWIRENLHCGALDFLMPKLTLLGEGGAVWIVAGLALTASKKVPQAWHLSAVGAAGGLADLQYRP